MIAFRGHGPFDDEEKQLITEVAQALDRESAHNLLGEVRRQVNQLERLGELVCSYPSLYARQSLGCRERDVHSLVELLCQSDLSNFDMFLPTRAVLARDLVMGEVNFYRLLRMVCHELPEEQQRALISRVDRCLCQCLYSRLTEEVLKHIASDHTVDRSVREKAVLALVPLWERTTYRISEFFPVLQATWEARRRVPVVLGTLLGTAEMFRLLEAGCDERFVDYLVRPDHTEDEAAAFREFLFGTTTEMLASFEDKMTDSGKSVLSAHDLSDDERPRDVTLSGDPALAMFQFFLSRHLQAAARRQAGLPGPKRTAEEYVLLHYLEQSRDEALSLPRP